MHWETILGHFLISKKFLLFIFPGEMLQNPIFAKENEYFCRSLHSSLSWKKGTTKVLIIVSSLSYVFTVLIFMSLLEYLVCSWQWSSWSLFILFPIWFVMNQSANKMNMQLECHTSCIDEETDCSSQFHYDESPCAHLSENQVYPWKKSI